MNCKICSNGFEGSKDSIAICKEKGGMVHLGCCINNCSWDKKPCGHSIGVYDKIS